MDNTNTNVVSVVPGSSPVVPSVVSPVPPSVTPVAVSEGGRIGPAGPKGDPGTPGPKGEPGGTELSHIAATSISGHHAVLLNTDGQVEYATNTVPSHSRKVAGVSSNAAASGDTVSIVAYGKMEEPSWNWDITKPVYLGDSGVLTQVTPSYPDAQFVLIIGFPLSSTRLFINPGISITLTE